MEKFITKKDELTDEVILVEYKDDYSKKVIVPDGITTLGPRCFYKKSFTEIVIPNSVKRICEMAFENCINLESVKIGNSLESIENSAFNSCYSLKDINLREPLKRIGSNCFSYTDLRNVVIPESVEYIGPHAFSMSSIEFVEIKSSNIEKIEKYSFFYCESLRDIDLGNTIKELAQGSFAGCAFKKIKLARSLEKIDSAFCGNEMLEEVIIEGGKALEFNAAETFARCKKLKIIRILDPTRENVSSIVRTFKTNVYYITYRYEGFKSPDILIVLGEDDTSSVTIKIKEGIGRISKEKLEDLENKELSEILLQLVLSGDLIVE